MDQLRDREVLPVELAGHDTFDESVPLLGSVDVRRLVVTSPGVPGDDVAVLQLQHHDAGAVGTAATALDTLAAIDLAQRNLGCHNGLHT